MSAEVPYRVTLFLLLALFVAHRVYHYRRHALVSAARARAVRTGGADLLVTLLGLTASVVTAVYLVRPSLLSWASLALPGWLRWSGAVPGLGGLLLLDAAQRALGIYWSIEARLLDRHRIVRAGPYRRVRHPMYTALMLLFGGLMFLSANWAVGSAWLATLGVDVGRRVREEEALFLGRFGQEYRDYQAVTGRFFPRLRGGGV